VWDPGIEEEEDEDGADEAGVTAGPCSLVSLTATSQSALRGSTRARVIGIGDDTLGFPIPEVAVPLRVAAASSVTTAHCVKSLNYTVEPLLPVTAVITDAQSKQYIYYYNQADNPFVAYCSSFCSSFGQHKQQCFPPLLSRSNPSLGRRVASLHTSESSFLWCRTVHFAFELTVAPLNFIDTTLAGTTSRRLWDPNYNGC